MLWKYVLYCLNNKNYCLNNATKQAIFKIENHVFHLIILLLDTCVFINRFFYRSNPICNYWNNCWRLKWLIYKHNNLYADLYLHKSNNFCLHEKYNRVGKPHKSDLYTESWKNGFKETSRIQQNTPTPLPFLRSHFWFLETHWTVEKLGPTFVWASTRKDLIAYSFWMIKTKPCTIIEVII